MSSVLHAAEIDDERDKNQIGMQDRLVDGIRGCPCPVALYDITDACRDLFIGGYMGRLTNGISVRPERREMSVQEMPCSRLDNNKHQPP